MGFQNEKEPLSGFLFSSSARRLAEPAERGYNPIGLLMAYTILGLPTARTFPYGLRLRIDTATHFSLAGGRGPSIAPIERLGNPPGFPDE
jgi:hypothetical protein